MRTYARKNTHQSSQSRWERSRGVLQRTCSCSAGHDDAKKCEACGAKRLDRQQSGSVGGMNGTAPSSVHRTLSSAGEPIHSTVRGFFEQRMGTRFDNVRVHADSGAAASSKDVSARAYTVGEHIAFGAGEYRPETVEGRRLLAHELTHVVQQRGGTSDLQRAGLEVAAPGTAQEREADDVADRVASGRDAAGLVRMRGRGVQRAEVLADVKSYPQDDNLRKEARTCIVHVHADERESLETAWDLAEEYNVNLVYLSHRKRDPHRCLPIADSAGEEPFCTADANRILPTDRKMTGDTETSTDVSSEVFSGFCKAPVGKKKREEAYEAIRTFRKGLIREIDTCRRFTREEEAETSQPLLYLHNNSIDEALSVEWYMTGGKYAKDAKEVLARVDKDRDIIDPDDFVLVTQQADFDAFKSGDPSVAGKFNVVLQNNDAHHRKPSKALTKDGSASVYFRNDRFFNLEIGSNKGDADTVKHRERNLARARNILSYLNVPLRTENEKEKAGKVDRT